jgi:hypothetical protein
MTTNRPVFTVAPPESDRSVPVQAKVSLAPVKKPVVTMTRKELRADLERNPNLVRPLLDQYYSGRLKGVLATDIIELADASRAKASLTAKAQTKVNAVGALANHVLKVMGGGR